MKYVVPWRRRELAKQRAARQAARERHRQYEARKRWRKALAIAAATAQSEKEEQTPVPRVRTIAWVGSLQEADQPPPASVHKLRTPRKIAPAPAAAEAPPSAGFDDDDDDDDATKTPRVWTAGAVLSARIVLIQSLLAALLTFGAFYGLLRVLRAVLYKTRYWPPEFGLTDARMLAVLVGGPILATLLGGLFTPLTMPLAWEGRWLGRIEPTNLPIGLLCLPIFQGHLAVVRLALLGLLASSLAVPLGLLFASYGLEAPIMNATFEYFGAAHAAITALLTLPFAQLTYWVGPNHDRAINLLRRAPTDTEPDIAESKEWKGLCGRTCAVCQC